MTDIRISIYGISGHFSNPYIENILGPLMIVGAGLFLFLVVTGTVARHRALYIGPKNVHFESWLFFRNGPVARKKAFDWKDIRLVRTGRSRVLGIGLDTAWVRTKNKELRIREVIEVDRSAFRNGVFPALRDLCKKKMVRFEDQGNWESGFERRAWEFPGVNFLGYGLICMLGWVCFLFYYWSRLSTVLRPSSDNVQYIFLLIILPIIGALVIAFGCKEIVSELIKADDKKKGKGRRAKKYA